MGNIFVKKGVFVGLGLVLVGIALLAYWDYAVRPEEKARELLVEGNLQFERQDKKSLNEAINRYSRVIARYPDTRSASLAYYNIARSYEKLELNQLAYLKYVYILKSDEYLTPERKKEIQSRIARLRVLREQTEEGVHQLFALLAKSEDRDFRSRVYTELGHAYLRTGELHRSKRMFDIALSENGQNEEAILGKARALKRLGHSSDAYDLYEYFLKYYGEFSNYADDVRKSYLDQVYRSGYSSFIRGSYWNAVSFFKRLIRNFPGSSKVENAYYWMGESYFRLEKYDAALKYFGKALSNGYHHKDQDARIRRGYTYFVMKKYDLAAREFEIYLKDYPKGRHADTAREWKEMSTRELMYRINNRTRDDESYRDRSNVDEVSAPADDEKSVEPMGDRSPSEEVPDVYENVAEL